LLFTIRYQWSYIVAVRILTVYCHLPYIISDSILSLSVYWPYIDIDYWTTWWPHNNSQHVDYYGELFLFTKILIDWLFIIDLWYTISYNIRSLIMYGKWQYTSAIILGQWLYMVSDNIRHWWCTVNVNIRSVYGQLQYTITDNVW
jgi:hypothetical protein